MGRREYQPDDPVANALHRRDMDMQMQPLPEPHPIGITGNTREGLSRKLVVLEGLSVHQALVNSDRQRASYSP